ncbi:MAG: hypothetical protein P4L46_06720 [Fimbriimonas sp.]|nr:hypothetical protein [Fimbriimonas sp.]
MRKLALWIFCVVAAVGCSHDMSSAVGTWKSKAAILVFKADQTWTIVGLKFDSGTWSQNGSQVTITPTSIKGLSRAEYNKKLRAAGGDQLSQMQALDKAFAPVNLTLDSSGQTLSDKSGELGDLTRQKS